MWLRFLWRQRWPCELIRIPGAPGKRSNIGGVSRIQYPGNARRRPFIFAIYPELSGDAGRCGRHLIPVRPCFGRGLPCSRTLVLARWALTPPFHPYPGDGAVYFLWHCPARGVLSTVSRVSPGLPVLRSPDFPLSLQRRRSDRPRRYSTRIKPNPNQSEWQRADGPETVARNRGQPGRRGRCRASWRCGTSRSSAGQLTGIHLISCDATANRIRVRRDH